MIVTSIIKLALTLMTITWITGKQTASVPSAAIIEQLVMIMQFHKVFLAFRTIIFCDLAQHMSCLIKPYHSLLLIINPPPYSTWWCL